MSFTDFGFQKQIEQGIESQGFKEPTPIQKQAIPIVLQGGDLMGLAQTGTGKTAAFALPILQRLMSGPRRRLRALVISPTRELAEQTHDTFVRLGKFTGLKSIPVYGGVNINPQKSALRGGRVEIVVACPGRLLDHLGQGTVNLSQVEVLVLDEADRLMDMGFLPDIKRILKYVPRDRQSMMFSATMPDEIKRLTGDVLTNYATVQIGRSAPAQNVTHMLFPVEKHLKTALLTALLAKTGGGPVLVFTRTRDRAERLGQQLKRSGFPSASLQGSMTQNKRQAALEGFREGKYQVLVATDVAARGIDVEDISHVINYDMPGTVEDYIHRVGRTGRASKNGVAFTLVTSEDHQAVRALERSLDVELVTSELEDFDYGKSPAPVSTHKPHKGERRHETHGKRREHRAGGAPGGGNGRKPGERPRRRGEHSRRPAAAHASGVAPASTGE